MRRARAGQRLRAEPQAVAQGDVATTGRHHLHGVGGGRPAPAGHAREDAGGGGEHLDRAGDVERLGLLDGEDGDAHGAMVALPGGGGKDIDPTISAMPAQPQARPAQSI